MKSKEFNCTPGSGSESWLGRRAKRAQQEAVLIMFWRWVKG
jgi:hypothetical protein